MIINFKYITQLHPLTAFVLSVVALLAWIPDFVGDSAPVGALVATMLLTLLNGLALMQLLYSTNITRYRRPLPVVLYLICTTAFPEVHTLWQDQIAVFVLSLCALILHNTYHRSESQESAFVGTLLLLIGSYWVPVMVWYLPLFLVAMIFQQSLSLRSLLASLLAIALYALYYAIACYFLPSVPLFSWELPGRPMIMLDSSLLSLFVSGCVCLVVGLYFAIHLLWRLYRESNRMRFVVILGIAFLVWGAVFSLFPSAGVDNLPLLIYPFSLLATLYFQQKEDWLRSIIFVSLLLSSVVSYFL